MANHNFQAGGLLLFPMHSMYCSLDNKSPNNRIRWTLDAGRWTRIISLNLNRLTKGGLAAIQSPTDR